MILLRKNSLYQIIFVRIFFEQQISGIFYIISSWTNHLVYAVRNRSLQRWSKEASFKKYRIFAILGDLFDLRVTDCLRWRSKVLAIGMNESLMYALSSLRC